MTDRTTSEPIITAIVTGAAQGVGRAEAEHLIASGRKVVLNDIDNDLLEQTVAELGGSAVAIGVSGDVASSDTADELISAATSEGATLDTVVNNAAALKTGMVVDHTESDWDKVLSVTLTGTFLLSRAAARYWRDHPSDTRRNLILTTSRAALLANPGQTAYAAAKAGAAVMAQTLAREMESIGVQVNAIAPRAYTKMMRDGVGEFAESALAEWSPSHIGRFVEYLCSPASSGVSGQIFVVHGPRVQLVRPYEVLEPVTFETGTDTSAASVFDELFRDHPRRIPAFMVDDLPLADTSSKSPFDVSNA